MASEERARLPQAGAPWADIEARMRSMSQGDVKWRDGRAAVYVFNAGAEVEAVQKQAAAMFASENGLGPAAFPSLAQMEREVVAFGLGLLNAPADAGGMMTSGGTDSILMAVKTARDFARSQGKAGPFNIALPRSAHPAFDKAAALMDLEVRRTPLKGYLADPETIAAACDARTILIVGSAPCFPYGLIDPIDALSALASERGLWLHVDACVGGYQAPFVRMNGAALPAFDFALAGVRSMSADLHKYGFCAKGASTVFFRDKGDLALTRFDISDWPAGRMITPTLAGTRPGGPIAAAWAVMNFLGVAGYRAKHSQVTDTRARIEAGARALGFRVIGAPQLGIVSFTHDDVDALAVLKRVYARGWVTSALTEPRGLHLMLSPEHANFADDYLSDLGAALTEVRAGAGEAAAARYGAV